MSVESMASALRLQGLPPVEKLLLIGIANHDGDGGAWPSMATLAMYVGLSVRQTQRTVQKLVDRGLVEVGVNEGGNQKTKNDRRPNLYILHIDGVTSQAERGDTQTSPRGVTPDVTRTIPGTIQEPSIVSSQPSAFDVFLARLWDAYPSKRRDHRDGVRTALRRVLNNKYTEEEIWAGLQRWLAYWDAAKTAPTYIPLLPAFLSRKKFDTVVPDIEVPVKVPFIADTAPIFDWVKAKDPYWFEANQGHLVRAVNTALKMGYGVGEIAVRVAIQCRVKAAAFIDDHLAVVRVQSVVRFPGGLPTYRGAPTTYAELMDLAHKRGTWMVRK